MDGMPLDSQKFPKEFGIIFG